MWEWIQLAGSVPTGDRSDVLMWILIGVGTLALLIISVALSGKHKDR